MAASLFNSLWAIFFSFHRSSLLFVSENKRSGGMGRIIGPPFISAQRFFPPAPKQGGEGGFTFICDSFSWLGLIIAFLRLGFPYYPPPKRKERERVGS